MQGAACQLLDAGRWADAGAEAAPVWLDGARSAAMAGVVSALHLADRGPRRRAAARQPGQAERADRADARGARRPLRGAGADARRCGAVIVTGDGRQGLLHRGRHHRLGADGAARLRPRTGCARGTGSSTGWRGLRKPTIAALNGHAFGGGLELAAACDIRVMAPRATLALPEAGVGIVPGWSGTQRLARLLPEPVVKEMALFGRRIGAERALALGFVRRGRRGRRAPRRGRSRSKAATLSPRAVEVAKYMIQAGVGRGPRGADRGAGGGHDRRERRTGRRASPPSATSANQSFRGDDDDWT